MRMMGYYKSGPCYNNVSLIKRAIFQSKSGKLPYDDIVLYLKTNWGSHQSPSMSPEILVELALFAPKSYFEEDETGLWTVKKQESALSSEVYQFVKKPIKPFTVKKVAKELHISAAMITEALIADVRFAQIDNTAFWILSEWEMVNDLVYEYLQKRRINTARRKEILAIVAKEYELNEENLLFAPEIDDRFQVKGQQIFVDLHMEEDETSYEVEVPVEVREEIARSSVHLIELVRDMQTGVKVKQLIPRVFGIRANSPTFPIYYTAVEEFFSSLTNMTAIGKGQWALLEQESIPDFKVEKPLVANQVRDSVPTLRNIDELLKISQEQQTDTEDQDTSGDGRSVTNGNLSFVAYHTISYFERIRGYFPISPDIRILLCPKGIGRGKLDVHVEGFSYEWWWIEHEGKHYFFGDGVADYFAEYLLEPGHRLRIEWIDDSDAALRVDVVGFDEVYASEQARYLDIGRLVAESYSVNKSIFTIMCEVLSTYPSGLHAMKLLELVNDIRSTTKNTVYNILSKNNCFMQVDGKKGYWRLDIRHLSRYYTDENDVQREEHKTDIQREAKVQKRYVDPYAHDAEYELEPLWEVFYRKALDSPNMYFETAKRKASTDDEFIELITMAYAKLLCKMARSQADYSMERMDLVQEGFFGVMKAVETYDEEHSFAHHVRRYIWRTIFREVYNQHTLIRFPVHVMEDVNKWEKLLSKALLIRGDVPRKGEMDKNEIDERVPDYALLSRVNYISFEQYVAYKIGKQSEWFTDNTETLLFPWYVGDDVDRRTQIICLGREIRDYGTVTMYNPCEEEYLTWEDVVTDEDDYLSEEVCRHLLTAELNKCIAQLDEREQMVISLRFGFEGKETHTLQEVGKVIGVTRERIRQIESRALERLRKLGEARGLQEYLA